VPTADDAAVAVRLRAATARLNRRLRRQSDAPATQSQLSALGSIEQAGAVTLGELAAREQVTPPTMTRVVQALEAQGWVARSADPDDGRVSRLALTGGGHALLADVRGSRDAWIARRLGELSPAERADVPRLVELLELLADRPPADHRERPAAGVGTA